MKKHEYTWEMIPLGEKMMMSRIDVKMMESKELRELRMYIREELDFRADIGREIQENEDKKMKG